MSGVQFLCIGPRSYLRNRSSDGLYRFYEHLFSNYRHQVLDTTYLQNQVIDAESIIRDTLDPKRPVIMFFYAGPWLGNADNRLVNHERYTKIYDLQDQKTAKQRDEILRPYDFTCCLFRYDGSEIDELRAALGGTNTRFEYFPHFINLDEFRDYGLAKRFGVLYYGNISDAYPFRKQLYKVIRANAEVLNAYIIEPRDGQVNGFRFERYARVLRRFISGRRFLVANRWLDVLETLLPRPGGGIRHRELARLINSAWLTTATTVGNHDRFVQKFAEIPLSSSCILGNYPTRHGDLFRGRIVELNTEMTDGEIVDVIRAALSDKQELTRKTQELRMEMASQFGYRNGVKRFGEIVESLFS